MSTNTNNRAKKQRTDNRNNHRSGDPRKRENAAKPRISSGRILQTWDRYSTGPIVPKTHQEAVTKEIIDSILKYHDSIPTVEKILSENPFTVTGLLWTMIETYTVATPFYEIHSATTGDDIPSDAEIHRTDSYKVSWAIPQPGLDVLHAISSAVDNREAKGIAEHINCPYCGSFYRESTTAPFQHETTCEAIPAERAKHVGRKIMLVTSLLNLAQLTKGKVPQDFFPDN